MRPVVTAVAVIIIAVCVNTQTQKSCQDDGGKCLAVAGRSCRMLQYNTCPDGAVCCAQRSRKTRQNSARRCKTSGKCRRKLGTCVSRQAGVCESKTRDRWCKGRRCTCCLPKKQSCSVSSVCASAGGSCVSTKSVRCAGQMLNTVCGHPKCSCCLPPLTCVCGIANEERIVGGVEVSPHEFPWLVGLQFNNGSTYSCGGSIINNLYILTAAHCLYDQETFQPRDPTCIRVGIADHNQASHQDDVPGVTRLVNIQGYSIHPNYTFFNVTDDIALVKLAQPLDLSSHMEVRSVCLPPNDNQTYQGLTATAAGWGYVTEGSTTQPDVLRQVGITILDPTCQNKTVAFYTITPNMLCAGEPQGGVDTCGGDSGGPLTVTQGGRHIIVGIASFGDGCARPNTPGVYTRVSKYLPWIMQTTQDATYCASIPGVKRTRAAKTARTNRKLEKDTKYRKTRKNPEKTRKNQEKTRKNPERKTRNNQERKTRKNPEKTRNNQEKTRKNQEKTRKNPERKTRKNPERKTRKKQERETRKNQGRKTRKNPEQKTRKSQEQKTPKNQERTKNANK